MHIHNNTDLLDELKYLITVKLSYRIIITRVPPYIYQLKLISLIHKEMSELSSNFSNYTEKMIDTVRLAIESNYMRSSKLNLSILEVILYIDILMNRLKFYAAKTKRA